MRSDDGFADLIAALTILAKYAKGYGRRFPTHCEHDVLQVGVDPATVSPEDLATLEDLGFIPDHEAEPMFKSYRFGSA